MAIQPIDLQALFTQLDKVGKSQAVQREGQQIQAAIQQVQNQRKMEESVQSVNETQEMGEEAEKIRDDTGRGAHANQGRGNSGSPDETSAEEDSAADEKHEFIRDPALGRNIDISG